MWLRVRARAPGWLRLAGLVARGPRARGPALAARDYRDVTLSLWPPWTGVPPGAAQPAPAPHLASPPRFLRRPASSPFPAHPWALLSPDRAGRRAFWSAGLGGRAAFGSCLQPRHAGGGPSTGHRRPCKEPRPRTAGGAEPRG